MSDDLNGQPKRRANGTFEKGHTANRKGRPPRSKKIPHPETYRDRALALADYKTPATLDGKKTRLTLFERNLLALAMAGAGSKDRKPDVAAAKEYLRIMTLLIEQELRFMRHEQEELKGEPTYLRESDPERREWLQKQFMHAVEVARGRRETSMPNFPPPLRRPRR